MVQQSHDASRPDSDVKIGAGSVAFLSARSQVSVIIVGLAAFTGR
jgi:hypothetical protein